MAKKRWRRKAAPKRAKRKALPTVAAMQEKVQSMKRKPKLSDADYKMLSGIEGSLRKLRKHD